jgi:hypothetical protein
MPINYLSGDPRDGVSVVTPNVAASPDAPANRVGFNVENLPNQQAYAQGTDGFAAWQAREAALRTVSIFEAACGQLPGWRGQANVKRIYLMPLAGDDLNAYYNRQAVQFFRTTVAGATIYTGASAEVVAHEVGHGILDALRPDLWNSPMMEIAAFHEGFGDCIAIMTALSEQAVRQRVLALDPQLNGPNFVEAFGEELSWGIANRPDLGPNHNAAVPRRAANAFLWNFPDQLPDDGGPGVLINESHCLGQLVSGPYWRLIMGLFRAPGAPGGEAGLWTACQTATQLLAAAVDDAPVKTRFLESVGRTMLVVDPTRFGGANGHNNRDAYDAHGIAVSEVGFLAPRAALAPTPPTISAVGVGRLGTTARNRVREALAVAPDAKLQVGTFKAGGKGVVKAVAEHEVSLTGLSERLQGVVCQTPSSALVGDVGGAAALLGSIESPAMVDLEVQNFVRTLVRRGAIAYGKAKKGGAGAVATTGAITHAVRMRSGKPTLERRAFACGCCR